jgi:hypothetical protein
MENFNTECKAIKEMIDFEMKTTEDYINNMDIEQQLDERVNALNVIFVKFSFGFEVIEGFFCSSL